MVALEVRDIFLSYVNGFEVLRGVDFDLIEGEIVALLGESGAGKTTILRAIAGFEDIRSGSISLFGRVLSSDAVFIPPEKRQLGMMFQDYALFPHMTVEQNICFGLKKLDSSGRAARVKEMMDLVRLPLDKLPSYPHELSGGQQQRVALARSMAPSPKLLLLDEPFSNLDPAARQSLAVELRDILKSVNTTSIMVTHNERVCDVFADKVVHMIDGKLKLTKELNRD